ncbi:MAG: winged helix-turn-helix domain-containing protein [Roseomonas sp.]|nr:winged helix-turn-helix domain-containing protein [Roseomonas sp.]
MANSDVSLALSVQTIVFAAQPRLRRSRHAPRKMRAARRTANEKRCCLPVNLPCYPAFGIISDGGMQAVSGGRKIRFGHCTLDDGRGVLIAPNGAETLLRPKTLDLLRLFLRNPGRVVGRSEILDAVWPGLFVSDDSITQCVVELRRAMGEVGTALLRTVPRRGYLLQAPVMVEEGQPVSALALLPPVQDDIPSIAVLPFRKFQYDPENAYFADGIVEGIVHVLSGLERLRVISRGSALALAERTVDPREIGRALGVRYVLYGGVQRAGDRLRISTELSESEQGSIIGVNRHEGSLSDLFALQDRIADETITAIAPQLRRQELLRALRAPPEKNNAYDLILRALAELQELNRSSFQHAHEFLKLATAADPSYAAAYSYIGWYHMLCIGQGWSDDNQRDAEAAALNARLAVDRSPNDPLALAVLGHTMSFLRRDFSSANALLEQAMAFGPSSSWAWSFASATAGYLGNAEEAVKRAEHALRLSPLDPFVYLHEHLMSQAHYVSGAFEAAFFWAWRTFEKSPTFTSNLRILVASAIALGRQDNATVIAERLMDADPGFRLSSFSLRTPLSGNALDTLLSHLRKAGLPE